MDQANTHLEYLYRDASNYKFRHTVVVRGALSLGTIERYLFDGLWFVPEKLGLPSLVPVLRNADDHVLHEIVAIAPTAEAPTGYDARTLFDAIRRHKGDGWFS